MIISFQTPCYVEGCQPSGWVMCVFHFSIPLEIFDHVSVCVLEASKVRSLLSPLMHHKQQLQEGIEETGPPRNACEQDPSCWGKGNVLIREEHCVSCGGCNFLLQIRGSLDASIYCIIENSPFTSSPAVVPTTKHHPWDLGVSTAQKLPFQPGSDRRTFHLLRTAEPPHPHEGAQRAQS